MDDDDNTDDTEKNVKPPNNKKMPPIVITQEMEDYSKFIKRLKDFTRGEPKVHYSRDKLSIYAENQADFDTLKNELDIAGCTYYTFPTKDLKTKKLVARGLPEMPPEEIKTELESQSINCVKVIPLRKKENAPTGSPIYLVDFPNNTDLKAVRNVRYIGYIRVHWERYRNRRKATQWHRCQQFGHGTAYCKNAPQCVKCDRPHLTQDCLKKREEPPKCVNCEGNHPANYSKCPAYLNYPE